MKGCILIKTESGRHGGVAREVKAINGVKAAFPVMGRTDVVAVLEAPDLKSMSRLVLRIGAVAGVAAAETLLALEV